MTMIIHQPCTIVESVPAPVGPFTKHCVLPAFVVNALGPLSILFTLENKQVLCKSGYAVPTHYLNMQVISIVPHFGNHKI